LEINKNDKDPSINQAVRASEGEVSSVPSSLRITLLAVMFRQ